MPSQEMSKEELLIEVERLQKKVALLKESEAQLKKAEAQMREESQHSKSMYQATDFAVYRLRIDPSRKYNAEIVLASDSIQDLIGCPDPMDFNSYFINVHPDDLDYLVEENNRWTLADEVHFNVTFRMNHPEKGLRWLNVIAWGALCHQEGTCMYTNGIVFDVTERKEAEAELERVNRNLENIVRERTAALERARIEAEDANVAKSDFLTNMSHEIRTPINVMLGIGQVLQETELTAVQQQCIELLSSSGNRLLDLISDILDLSKIESGTISISSKPFDLAETVSSIEKMMRVEADRKGLGFSCSVAPDIPAKLVGDAQRLRQIIINLVANAIKYTHQGEVVVRVVKILQESGVVHVDIEVSDTGVGISGADQDHIFDRFIQVDSTSTRVGQGSGLGLTIASRLADMMGGSIDLRSRPGHGSTFTVSIPFLLQAADEFHSTLGVEHDSFLPPAPDRSGKMVPAGSFTIENHADTVDVLIVEDDESNRMLMELFLKKAPVNLSFAVNGREALNCAVAKSYDVILMDMQMPLMDGYEATRRIRSMELVEGRPPVKILAVTANSLLGERAKCLACGCDEFLTKPVRKHELLDLIMYLASA